MPVDEPIEISADVAHEKIGDETVLLHLETGVYFGLDPIGARVFELLRETKSARAVVERIVEEYDVSIEVAAQDVQKLLDDLVARKIVVINGAVAAAKTS